MLRSTGAVAAGFIVTALLVVVTDAVMAKVLPSLFPTPQPGEPVELTSAGLAINFRYAFVYAVVGGYVMASVARDNAKRHLAWLLLILALFGVVSAFAYAGMLPVWYEPLVVGLGAAGCYMGARFYVARAEASRPFG